MNNGFTTVKDPGLMATVTTFSGEKVTFKALRVVYFNGEPVRVFGEGGSKHKMDEEPFTLEPIEE